MTKVTVEEHSSMDKSFLIEFKDMSLKVDYDDVNHEYVDAATEHLKEIIETYWDAKKVDEYYKSEIIKVWDKNEYNLQSDYEDFNDYLSQHGL